MDISTIKAYVPNHSKVRPIPLWRAVGLPASHGPKLIHALADGLPVCVIDKLTKELNIPITYLFEITGLKLRNYTRRKQTGKLSPNESEIITRYIRVVDAVCICLNNDRKDAVAWMNEPAEGLGGTPDSFIHTEAGSLEVMRLIGRINHGVFI